MYARRLFIADVLSLLLLTTRGIADAPRTIPNELGSVMILMYHKLGERESTWARTPENFEKDLKVLYEKGYRPVSISDFVQHNISLPAGFTPFLITFDDGDESQFRVTLNDEGQKVVDPRSAVGILGSFSESHPDFALEATFFLDGKNPFDQRDLIDFKINYLIDHGMDIGNHTTGHQNLSHQKYQYADIIQKAIGSQAVFLEARINKPSYPVNTLALCFGQRPRSPLLRRYLQKGQFNGKPYENIAIFNVGSGPSHAPMDKRFDPGSIPRIRASEIRTEGFGLYDWLEYFDKHPEKRFVSDGDVNTITIPKGRARYLARERLGGKSIIILDD